MFKDVGISTLFCTFDELLNEFNAHSDARCIGNPPNLKPKMSQSEVLWIYILFQLSGMRCYKWFYNGYVKKHMKDLCPQSASFNSFVEVQKKC